MHYPVSMRYLKIKEEKKKIKIWKDKLQETETLPA